MTLHRVGVKHQLGDVARVTIDQYLKVLTLIRIPLEERYRSASRGNPVHSVASVDIHDDGRSIIHGWGKFDLGRQFKVLLTDPVNNPKNFFTLFLTLIPKNMFLVHLEILLKF